ncbi:MAG: hypothetical protein HY369_03195 [Candidatus Aenigmarchaeota archaeon]|nr:hypothetical protein [Candidatus Aenigmarchaeota archaeon]
MFPPIRTRHLLILVAVGFVAVHLVFFPSYFASIDEHEYLKNAFLLQGGTLTEPAQTASCEGKFTGDGYVSQYFIGRSAFLVPFTWAGFEGVMLSGLVIHLLNFALIVLILRKWGVSPLYALLYLLFPAMLWEARTLNSELLALTGLLAATFFYLGKKPWQSALAGLFFGLAALPRYEVILLAIPFFLVPLCMDRRKFLAMLAGFVPAALLLLGTNALFYGGILEHGYSNELGEIFAFETGIKPFYGLTLVKFLVILAAVLPLLILSPVVAPPALRKELLLATVIFLLFYAQNVNIADAPWLHPTAVTGQIRYLIPLIGLLLLTYPFLVRKVLGRLRLPEKPVLSIAIVALFAAAILASSVHATFLDGRRAVFDQIYAHTTTESLLIGSSDDCNYVLNELFADRAYLDVGTANLAALAGPYGDVYLLDIRYGTVDYSSPRGKLVAGERQQVADFLAQHAGELTEVFSSSQPHHVTIYRWEAT